MTRPPTVTLEQVERVAPWGVIHIGEEGADPIQTVFKTVTGEPLMTGWHEVVKPIATSDLHYTTRYLSPEQIVERLRVVECNNCDGRGTMPPPAWQEPYTPSPKGESQCLRCAGTGYIDPDPQLRSLFA